MADKKKPLSYSRRGEMRGPTRPRLVELAETIENNRVLRNLAGPAPDILRSWGWDQRLRPDQYAAAAVGGLATAAPLPPPMAAGLRGGSRALAKAASSRRPPVGQRPRPEAEAKFQEAVYNSMAGAIQANWREQVAGIQRKRNEERGRANGWFSYDVHGMGSPDFTKIRDLKRQPVNTQADLEALNSQLPDEMRKIVEPKIKYSKKR